MKKGFTLAELLIVIVILGILSVIGLATFNNIHQKIREKELNNKISLIETKASEYASSTKVFMTNVDWLVKQGYIKADNEKGDVINPVDDSRMNCRLVIMYESDSNYYASVSEKEECDISKVNEDNIFTTVTKYKYPFAELAQKDGKIDEEALNSYINNNSDKTIGKYDWSKENILLKVTLDTKKLKEMGLIKEDSKIIYKWNNVDTNSQFYLVKASEEMNTTQTIKSEVYIDDMEYFTTIPIKIDKKAPEVKEINLLKEEWSNTKVRMNITVSDNSGSGIYDSELINEKDYSDKTCGEILDILANDKTRERNTSVTYDRYLGNGSYYICVKDNVGNVAKVTNLDELNGGNGGIVIDNIDETAPTCEITVNGTKGKNDWYISNVEFTFYAEDKSDGNSKPSGIVSKRIIVDGKDIDSKTSKYVLDKDRASFTVKVTASDKAGNNCSKEVTVKRDSFTPKMWPKSNPLTLNKQDYNFKNNINIEYGVSGGDYWCSPEWSLKNGSYNVVCSVTSNNGFSNSTSFTVRHSYPATYVQRTCRGNCHTVGSCCGSVVCPCDNPRVPCGATCYCTNNCYHEECDTYDCSYWSCPNGGSASGSICYY